MPTQRTTRTTIPLPQNSGKGKPQREKAVWGFQGPGAEWRRGAGERCDAKEGVLHLFVVVHDGVGTHLSGLLNRSLKINDFHCV